MAVQNNGHNQRAHHGHNPGSNPGGILALKNGAGEPGAAEPWPRAHEHEYAFLAGNLVDAATLSRAEAEAARCGLPVHAVLLASGAVSQAGYAAVLAAQLGLPTISWDAAIDIVGSMDGNDEAPGWAARVDGRSCRLLSATQAPPSTLLQLARDLQARGAGVVLAPANRIDAALEAAWRAERLDNAVRGLLRLWPQLSAGAAVWTWQLIATALAVGFAIGGFAVFFEATIAGLTALIAVPFLCVTLLRVVALRQSFAARKRPHTPVSRAPDHTLPIYTVLVPLLREANVLAGLVRSLGALDYPAAKLDVILVLEASDLETQAALLALALPANFRTVVVPDRQPRTKPKALNYALQFARGEYVVVYDAEDRPQPDQLRRAWNVFSKAPARLGCVQAQLNIYNPWQSWFTRGIMAQTPQELNPS